MKKTHSLIQITQKINQFSNSLKGVFSFSDLINLIPGFNLLRQKRIISRLVQEGVLHKMRRGLYYTPTVNTWFLACQTKNNSYVSMDTVLAKNGLIGTTPQFSISLVHPGRKTILKTHFGHFTYYSVQKSLLFGFDEKIPGLKIADSEKAYLDLLYAYNRGARFTIDPLQEVNTDLLNHKKILEYLKHYKNPKFVKFVKGLIK